MKFKFRAILCTLISLLTIGLSSTTFSAKEGINISTYEMNKDINIVSFDSAKEKVEEFVAENLKKYDISSKENVSYEGIVEKNSSFYDYAEKLYVLTNNRYKSFDTLRLEEVNYEIEYGDISFVDGLYTVNATVYEEKKYVGQDEPGYVCTEHTFTIEQKNDKFYIINDVTDDYVDAYLHEYAQKDNVNIDEIISIDRQVIQDTLELNDIEYAKLIKNVEKNNTVKLEINKIDGNYNETFNQLEKESDIIENDNVGTLRTYAAADDIEPVGSGVKTYSFNYSKMYEYAGCYNGASPFRKRKRNPAYTDYENLGGDCTNYISQILRAGGAPLDDTGNYQWYYYSDGNRSSSWTGVGYLYDYLINNDYIGPQGYLIKDNQPYVASKGDIIQLKFRNKSSYSHTLWITKHQTGTTSLTRIACHSSDRWNEPLDSLTGTRRWIKLTGYGK